MSKVLVVDDDANILSALRRQFRNRFEVETAPGGREGLQTLATKGPFPVVVSDFQMPAMNGVEFLSRVRKKSPESVCIMLTGQPDLPLAMEAVNRNEIFRFLKKPCPSDILGGAIESGISQFDLQQAEKEILTQTLTGCLKALTEILALVNPEAFGRTSRIQRLANRIAEELRLSGDWDLKIALMLSQVGCICVPQNVLNKFYKSEPLTQEEQNLYHQYPSVGSRLIERIPRLEKVAEIIRLQEKPFSECNTSQNLSDSKEDFFIRAHILKVAIDYDVLESSNYTHKEALRILSIERPGRYNPAVLDAAKAAFEQEKQYRLMAVHGHELEPRMILLEEIMFPKGKLIVAKGQELTQLTIQHIRYLCNAKLIKQPIKVVVPV